MINILLCITGTFGFCSILYVPKNKIIWIVIGSAISASIYEALYTFFSLSNFLATFLASTAIGIYSEIIARKAKTPATVILLPSTVPLLPGGTLYYCVNYLIIKNYENFIIYAGKTLSTGFAIAMGAVVTTIIVEAVIKIKSH